MNNDAIQKLVISAIQQVAPEIDKNDLEPDADIREACDLDSIDFLNFIIALKDATGVSIAEVDYPRVNTLTSMCEYLAEKLP
ncbi:acyl carrier protein [Moritella sp. Urea-trap-13]|uniref:acyl carrier protein n=1 Tax=Moritella sp. Urea-trap-13 TaxID=2058327 RepID=UPI000C31F9F3|nr:phosphopantetheine-binding protein [Moritella sp. Urea-trap-13]PKH06178.1 phosphopantetheine-binding protein [Moritella sp. Urea-trap-13]